MSVTSETTSRAVRGLESLLSVAEGESYTELLFTFALPADVVKKYEYMREQAMQKAGLYNSPSRIWQLQREAHAKQQQSEGKDVQTNTDEEARPETESISAKYELIARLDSSHELLKHYQKVLSSLSRAFDDLQVLSENETAVRRPVSQLTDLVRQSPDKPLRMSEFESSQTKLVKRYKQLESEAQVAYAKHLQELSLKQSNLEASLNRILSQARRQKERIRMLEVTEVAHHEAEQGDSEEVARLRSRLQSEKHAYEERLQRLREEHRASRDALIEDSRKAVKREMDELVKEKNMAIEEAQRLEIELEQQRKYTDAEIAELQSTYKSQIELLGSSLKEESEYRSQDHDAKVDELRRSHRLRENELLSKLERLTSDDHSAVSELRDKLSEALKREEDLHQLLRSIGERLHSIYLKYSSTHKDFDYDISRRRRELLEQEETWKVDFLMESDFVCYLVTKLSADNDWLVERLAEFGKENDRLKRKGPGSPSGKDEGFHLKVRESIYAATDALKDYEAARERLVEQFNVKSR